MAPARSPTRTRAWATAAHRRAASSSPAFSARKVSAANAKDYIATKIYRLSLLGEQNYRSTSDEEGKFCYGKKVITRIASVPTNWLSFVSVTSARSSPRPWGTKLKRSVGFSLTEKSSSASNTLRPA